MENPSKLKKKKIIIEPSARKTNTHFKSILWIESLNDVKLTHSKLTESITQQLTLYGIFKTILKHIYDLLIPILIIYLLKSTSNVNSIHWIDLCKFTFWQGILIPLRRLLLENCQTSENWKQKIKKFLQFEPENINANCYASSVWLLSFK